MTTVDARLGLDLTLLLSAESRDDTASPARRLMHDIADRLHDRRLDSTTVILEGDAKQALLNEAESWGADSIIIGARGHSRIERFLVGSVLASVAAPATCSVEVIRRRTCTKAAG